MLIGKGFNKICEKILLAAGEQSGFGACVKVSVPELADQLNLDRVEIKISFEYLVEMKLIKIESIGGPTLYGHISLTDKGILKLKSLRK